MFLSDVNIIHKLAVFTAKKNQHEKYASFNVQRLKQMFDFPLIFQLLDFLFLTAANVQSIQCV
jgi:hypothetical protein